MPMALMAVVVGAALAIAGAEMQTILNNPLASPFTLGISAAAGFGAALAIVLGVSVIPFAGVVLVSVNAFFFALLASLTIYFLSRLRGVTVQTVVLLGIALVFLFTSLLSLLQYIASEEALQQVVFWTLGSLVKATWPKIGSAAGVLAVTIPFFIRQAWALTALRLGDATAQSLGINIEKLRLQSLISVSILAAVAVAFVGTIGFVGLVGPHVARMLVGEDQRFFLPTAAVAGALLLSVTSIVSKSIIPGVLFPIGIITSLIGIPFFLSLILTKTRQLW
jgi:iron complex transport system permease protein